jgi:hypothetical protein
VYWREKHSYSDFHLKFKILASKIQVFYLSNQNFLLPFSFSESGKSIFYPKKKKKKNGAKGIRKEEYDKRKDTRDYCISNQSTNC